MSTLETASAATSATAEKREVVNDFSIQVATVNGSGSQTANLVLLRSLFQMGIPVSGKNLFPSNIAGLPTWYTIRTNKRGYIGRKKEIDFLVAMNPETAQEDVLNLEPGAAVVYDEPLKLNELRSDLFFYPCPFDELVKPLAPNPKLRKLVKNMLYDGVLAHLLGIEMEEIRHALYKQFSTKPKAAELNWNAAQASFEWAKENVPKIDPYRVERMNENQGKIIIEGNSAAALGCVFAGVTVVTWYPITPSSSLAENLGDYARRFRMDPETGKATFAIVQAEDELASIGMAIGAGWAGARSMTTTAGPGISLMSEFVGLGYFAEIPVVLFDVQRMGPSTGLPTRTSQGDLLSAATLSHGDTRHPLLIPSTPSEAFDMAGQAFDLAEELQTPVFVLLDLDLGMNYWMSDKFEYPEKPLDRGKVLTKEDLDRVGSFARYADVDGDGVPYRTLPGTQHSKAAYFTRGTGHTPRATYSEREDDWTQNMDRLLRKFETARSKMPQPEIVMTEGAKIGLVGCGTSHFALEESRDQLEREYDIKTSYYRTRGYPFSAKIEEFVAAHDRVYIVDQNRDGQLRQLMRLDYPDLPSEKLRSIRYYGGMPLDARTVTDELIKQEGL
ncbi:MAG: 2-oxoacid:acceptor oxidoreductase subunit alpha [Acidobacteria bacterium]|nr:2-oxoacid:acceptor oxidoreductase subunit alpha [Acidobacteriota bacterium]